MEKDTAVPATVQRTRRGVSAQKINDLDLDSETIQVVASSLSTVMTPKRRGGKSQKRVRFSDPGPVISDLDSHSTGLTPMVRRTSLGKNTTPRRHSTPGRASGAGGINFMNLDNPESPFSGEIRFLSLRQVLDGRVKRRIRRNGLSEEMNSINAEKRQRAREAKAEVDVLKWALAEKDDEIRRMQEETVVFDTERIWELEQQVEQLKKDLGDKASSSSPPQYDWTLAARDPFSGSFMDVEEDLAVDDDADVFGENTMAELACSTPSRRASRRNTSFPTPPTTSPASAHNAGPPTPCSHLLTPRSHSGVQASLPDPETQQLARDKEQLEDELASLQLEITKLTTTLESYQGLEARLATQLRPFTPAETDTTESSDAVEARLSTLLQTLSDRTAALLELNSSLSSLGFPGGDAHEIVVSLVGAFRAARLELEYLTPGEIELPLTSAGAAVLDLLLGKLRDLARRAREADDAVDEYHALETQLRQQLGARVSAMDGLVADVASRDERIAELEVGLERVRGMAASYAREVKELEALVGRLEGEMKDDKDRLVQEKEATVKEMEDKLQSAEQVADKLRLELEELRKREQERVGQAKDEAKKMNAAHGRALALRDARVAELRGEIDRVNTSLRQAHESVRVLRVDISQLKQENSKLHEEKEGLEKRREAERDKAKEALNSMRSELERVVRMSEGLLATPRKPAPRKRSVAEIDAVDNRRDSGLEDVDDSLDEVSLLATPTSARRGSLLAGDLARRGKNIKPKKRRRYDSGLGFLDEEEIDADA
jgi:hypothetical protein